MEPKYYDKPWILSFKGAFLIALGILFMVKLPGTIFSLGIFFSFFIGLTGMVLIAGTIALKKKENRLWNISLGVLNLLFTLVIMLKLADTGTEIYWVLVVWIIFNAITEIIEAVRLIFKKNSFFTVFLANAFLTLLLGLGLNNLAENFTEERLFNLAFISIVFGVINELSSYLLKSVIKPLQ
jgi:uncharacterized membrane protein HdeD (DUF308 family)